MTAAKKKRRVPLDVKVRRQKLRERVVELREANVPVRVIAQSLGVGESEVRNAVAAYYRDAAAGLSLTAVQKKEERVRQLEADDARLGLLKGIGPDPAALAKAGHTVREWLAAMELSRRIKAELIALEGLREVTQMLDPGGRDVLPGDPAYKAAAVKEWLDSLQHVNPALRVHIFNELTKSRQLAEARHEARQRGESGDDARGGVEHGGPGELVDDAGRAGGDAAGGSGAAPPGPGDEPGGAEPGDA